jgi:hypothetical protein
MSMKVFYLGMTLILAGDLLPIPAVRVVGAVIMIIGYVLYVLDK